MAVVREVENEWITLPDGCRLAARIWLPAEAASSPVPAILEYLPYRKRDGTAIRDEIGHPYMARRGYACVRVDMRGNGESEGLMADEYTPQELSDGVDVIAWIAGQPWCDGNVGMLGISWGGFNGLQIAALQPPALKAVITVCSTHDRYDRDIHYRGGCLLTDNMGWATQMLVYSSRPPDPLLVGDRWRKMWLERLDNMPLLAKTWLAHQRRDSYWKHGSVCEDYRAIRAAVLAVGGWADPYSDSALQLVEHLDAPCKALIGPWLHKYPHIARPEPAIGFLQESAAWWDRWLKNADNGVERLPKLRAYVMEGMDPSADCAAAPGRWVSENSWPSPDIRTKELFLTDSGELRNRAKNPRELHLHTPLTLGADSGAYCPGIRPSSDLPGDQRLDDGLSACFSTAPLKRRLEILGRSTVKLAVECAASNAQICARLCDIAPDGTSYRVSWGILNLTHRVSHEFPAPVPVGRRLEVHIPLDAVGYVFKPGHRIRLALSNSYWPTVWPAPEYEPVKIFTGSDTVLLLPVRPRRKGKSPVFALPEGDEPQAREVRPEGHKREVRRDAVSGKVEFIQTTDYGRQIFEPHGLENDCKCVERFSILPGDPDSALHENRWTFGVSRADWRTKTYIRTRMTSNAGNFCIKAKLVAKEGGKTIRKIRWKEKVPRDLL